VGIGKINLSKPTFLILFLVLVGIGLTIGAASAVKVFSDNLRVNNGAGDSEVEITSGTGDSKLTLTDKGKKEYAIILQDGKKKLVIKDVSKDKIRFALKNNGKVGIGTEFPQEKLDVRGNIFAKKSVIAASYFDIGNTQTGTDAIALGGAGNTASGVRSNVGGGANNIASGFESTVGGGIQNIASETRSTVGGGTSNTASETVSTVGGGQDNTASASFSTVGGGANNEASGFQSTIGGGFDNTASVLRSTVGGGNGNTASGTSSTIGGGFENTASQLGSTIPGGIDNTASGITSFAAGNRANAIHNGAFVWADSTDADFTSTAADQFSIRAAGGVRIDGDVLVTDEVSVSGNKGVMHFDTTGNFAQAAIFDPNPDRFFLTGGVMIENQEAESAGIYLDGDTAAIWSPGDFDILRVYDEDDFIGGSPIPKLRLTNSGNLIITGVFSTAGGVSPFLSFTGETHDSVREYYTKVSQPVSEVKEGVEIIEEPVMDYNNEVIFFWNTDNKRFEIYEIAEDKFYTITGELIP